MAQRRAQRGKKRRTEQAPDGDAIILNITHWTILRRYWGSILGTLALIALSTGLWLLQPWLLGRAIDGLVADDWRDTAYLGLLQVSVLIIGAARRYYDTRVYTRIYRDIGEETVTASQEAGMPITMVTARANMLREVVRFFEFRVPSTVRAAINLVGSLGLLAILSVPVFFACLIGMGSIVVLSLVFSGRLFRLNSNLNDQMEREVDVFEASAPSETRDHLAALAGWQIKRSDIEALMFALTSIIMLGVLLFSLYTVVSVENAQIGTVFSVFSYVTRFQFAVNNFPAAYQESIRTLEITRRINQIALEPVSGPQTKAALRALPGFLRW